VAASFLREAMKMLVESHVLFFDTLSVHNEGHSSECKCNVWLEKPERCSNLCKLSEHYLHAIIMQ